MQTLLLVSISMLLSDIFCNLILTDLMPAQKCGPHDFWCFRNTAEVDIWSKRRALDRQTRVR